MPHIVAVKCTVILKPPKVIYLGGPAAGANVHTGLFQPLDGDKPAGRELQMFQKQPVEITFGDVQMGA